MSKTEIMNVFRWPGWVESECSSRLRVECRVETSRVDCRSSVWVNWAGKLGPRCRLQDRRADQLVLPYVPSLVPIRAAAPGRARLEVLVRTCQY